MTQNEKRYNFTADNTFFTADTHFSHANIIKYKNRPFSSTASMDKALIENWNSVVPINGNVFHLGDVGFCTANSLDTILSQLNGRIFLIRGNHDKQVFEPIVRNRFEWIRDYYKLIVIDQTENIKRNRKQKVILCHYAFRVWDSSHHLSYSLYGHSHGSLPDDPNLLSLDVGVDCWDYKPVTYKEIRKRLSAKKFKPVDHHGKGGDDEDSI